jgi:LmeA-like phospholipid-binding
MRALIVLAVVLVFGVVIDRVAVAVAEDRVADSIAEEAGLPGPPLVDITGFPVLTQAVAGRYDEVRIGLSATDLGQPEGTKAEILLRGVEVPLARLLGGSVDSVLVDRIDGRATLAYELLSRELGPDTELTREGSGLRVTRTVEVLGQQVPLTAAGAVTLDGDDLVVDVEEASGAGVDLPPSLVEGASDLLDLRYTIPPLPFGLELTGVRPADDGVVVDVEAVGAVLGG